MLARTASGRPDPGAVLARTERLVGRTRGQCRLDLVLQVKRSWGLNRVFRKSDPEVRGIVPNRVFRKPDSGIDRGRAEGTIGGSQGVVTSLTIQICNGNCGSNLPSPARRAATQEPAPAIN